MAFEISELDREIRAAGIPIYGVSGVQGAVTVTYQASATTAQQSQGATIVANFDWVNADTNYQRASAQVAASLSNNILLRAVLLTLLDSINTLRTNAGLATISASTAKQAVLNKISSGAAD